LSDTTLYTFTVNPLNSAQLNTFLQTYRNTWCALEIYDSVNGILTTPLELQIMPGYSLSGTPTDNVAGVIVVAAGKTVTFPQSLTFPSALGTNGFQLTTDGAGALTWAAGTNAPGGSTTQVQYNNAGSFAGITGATTNGTALTLVAPVLGAATATSINGITITPAGAGTLTMDGDISTHGPSGGPINTSNYGGFINTSVGGGSIDTRGTGSIELGVTGTRTTFTGAASGTNKSIALPNASGTLVLNDNTATITNKDIVATQLSGTIAAARITGSLTIPGPIGAGTANTGAFTTLTSSSTTDSTTTATGAIQTLGGLGVAKSIFAGGNINIPVTTSTVGQIKQGSANMLNTFGSECVNLGPNAGNLTATGTRNLNIGAFAGGNSAAGGNNVAIGYVALQYNQSGEFNVAIGSSAGRGSGAGTSHYGLVAIGYLALGAITGPASYSVAIGFASGDANTTGTFNTFIGESSGRPTTTGSYNTCLGSTASTGAAAAEYRTAIGAGATGTANNQVMLGRAADIVTLPGGLVTVPVAQTASTAAVSVAVTTTALTTTAPAQAITLANGTNGQIKIITHIASSGGGTAVLTPATSAADYNTITFSSVGDTATLQYHTTGGWYILSLRGSVAA